MKKDNSKIEEQSKFNVILMPIRMNSNENVNIKITVINEISMQTNYLFSILLYIFNITF